MAVDLLTPPGQGDAGQADPRLRAALDSADVGAVAAALAVSRVFVGVESRLLELAAEQPGRRLPSEKASEMVLATLRMPSGMTALPVFSSVAALSAWRSAARPVPVSAADACAEAARLGHGTVVVDVAGPVTVSLDVSALAAGVGLAASPSDAAGAGQGAADPAGADNAPSGLRPPARPWDAARGRRVAAELDALATAGLARGARLWHAELVTGTGEASEVIALTVAGSGPAGEARLDEIALRLRAAVAGPGERALAVVFIDSQDVAGLRRALGRGITPRRWRRR
ncbi:SseB family protein [Pseudofrankia saprophytica]|uniref:SseB family protein n=1 Tax=Pseudofrankia saprophytica TaxID=298655 RepID=UPI000234D99D|nr:SseB family protein [Pseudofrankia saprophytica]